MFRLAHPDLEAITEEVVGRLGVIDRFRRRIILIRGRQLDIVFRQDPFAFPYAAVGIQFHQTEVVFRRGEQTAAAYFHAVGHAHPAEVVGIDADLVEKTGRKVIMKAEAGLLSDDRAKHRRTRRVVHVCRAGLVIHRNMHESADPVFFPRVRHDIHTASHAKHIADRQEFQIFARIFRRLIGEDIDQTFVQLDEALRVRNTDCGRRVCFCVALQSVTEVRSIRRPPSFGDHFVVTHDHQAMHLCLTFLQILDVFKNQITADTYFFRCPFCKGLSVFHFLSFHSADDHSLDQLALNERVNEQNRNQGNDGDRHSG